MLRISVLCPQVVFGNMDVLAPDVRKFLTEVGYTTSSDFLASPSTVLASQYEGWRAKNQKPKLRQDARSVVFTWKQEVAKTISSQQTHSGGSGSGKTSTTSTPAQQSRMSLPTASNRKPKTTEQPEITKEPIAEKLAIVSEFRENDGKHFYELQATKRFNLWRVACGAV